MRLRIGVPIVVVALGAGALTQTIAQGQSTATTASAPTVGLSAAEMQAVAGKYCVSCHNDRLTTGAVSFSGVDFGAIPSHATLLERAARKLLVGSMPPQGAPRPDAATLQAFATTIERALDDHGRTVVDPGRAVLRRLNRTEYANAVRDLLDLDVNVSALLPVDNSSFGFDNIGDVLGMSPVLMERYLTAARRISALAVGDAAEIATTADTYRVKPDRSQDQQLDGLPLGTRGGLAITHTFPLDAEYSFKVDLRQTTLNNVVGLEYPHDVIVLLDGVEIRRARIGGEQDLIQSFANSQGSAETFENRLVVRTKVSAGPHTVAATFIAKTAALRAGLLQPILRTTFDAQDYTGQPHIEALVVTGPFNATGPGDTPSRRRLFTCRPPHAAGAEKKCAQRILASVAQQAYRRPLQPSDVLTLERFYELGRPNGGFEAGVEMGIRRILASPDFVFRVERDPPGSLPGHVHRISDIELASRLSFFLWSTIPDRELLTTAINGRLSQPAVLETQVRRMLADPRSAALVDNFAGQWLYLRNLANIKPVPTEFPDFDDNLRSAMLREVQLLFDDVIHRDRSVMDLMTASDTFLNERLARHYGIAGIYGSDFRRVDLALDERRGLLGKGAILVVTSLASRTSPVVRGKWILDNVLGTPPPPPPPNVPALDEVGAAKASTLRARMEAHRGNAQCAGCHRMMDPIGFALENYDAVGRWRTRDGGTSIDSAGVLMDGSMVDGPTSLRRALTARPDVFIRTMTEKMLTYALGRGVGPSDMPAIRTVTRTAALNDYRFSSLVMGIVQSPPFQLRATPTAE